MIAPGLYGPVRGSIYPTLYSHDDTRLTYGDALELSVNRHFNPNKTYRDNTKPTLSVPTANMRPEGGPRNLDSRCLVVRIVWAA